jgi:phosphocarrier protein
MESRTVLVGTPTGLHARPAGVFVAAAKNAGIPVTIALGDRAAVNAASILAVLSLGIKGGDSVTIAADGADADGVVATLGDLLASDLDSAHAS